MSTLESRPNGTVLRAERLSRAVPGKIIVSDISFEVTGGEVLGIVGASGSGKSSLLRLVNRLDEPSAGTAYLDGEDYRTLPPRELRRRIGMVTQRPFLFPGDVASNLRFGPAQRGESLSDEEVSKLLAQVGLPGFASMKCLCFQGANSNVYLWRVRWPITQKSCCSMSPRRRSTSNQSWASRDSSLRWHAIKAWRASW